MTGRNRLNRRDFLASAAGGAACLALGGALAGPTRADAPPPNEDLHWLPAWRLRNLIESGEISPVEIIEHFLQRIEAIDEGLGSFVVVQFDRARAAARAAEATVLRGDPLGPLHGVPVSLKQMVQAEGLPLESGSVPQSDYVTSERIRRAGGIIIGNTTLAGPSSMLGKTSVGAANPWDLDRVAGASSSGAAASVAAGLVPIAIGSDGGGSTRLPAAWCGLIGMHPTVGRVPADHDIWRSLSRTAWSGTYGPICRDARDAAVMMSVIAGPDWRNIPSFHGPVPDYLSGLEGGVTGLRIAWTQDFGSASQYFPEEGAAVVAAARRSADGFIELGASVEDVALDLEDWYPVFTRIAAELSVGRPYPLFASAASAWNAIRGKATPPQWKGELEAALDARQKMAEQLLGVFEHYDILLSATSPHIAPTREAYSSWLESDSYPPEYTCLTGHMNLLGFPALSVPAGFVEGMPVGLQLIARPDEDAKLLRAAHALLRAFPQDRRPAKP
ncbi:MAG: amidase [bacterium]|nr:amidase [bacterium]